LKKNPKVTSLEEAIWKINNEYLEKKTAIDIELEKAQKELELKSELFKGFSSS
jgi:hypothetical protein